MIFSEAAWLSMNKNQIQILSIQEVIWLLQSQFISRFRMEAPKNKKWIITPPKLPDLTSLFEK